jgi:hypothetical protein
MNITPTRKKWPETAPYNDAIDAFDKVLSRAGWDEVFRKGLTESPASAKKAVAEIGEIDIPDDRVIVFFEPQGPKPAPADQAKRGTMSAAGDAGASQSSENVHVFYLPPLNKDDQSKKYTYEQFFMCCYDAWLRT